MHEVLSSRNLFLDSSDGVGQGDNFEVYASTVHAFQGKAVDHKLFIDSRRMFERQHWYTAVSRARRLEQLFYVDVPPPPPEGNYANTVIYVIRSPHTTWVYVGHTKLRPK